LGRSCGLAGFWGGGVVAGGWLVCVVWGGGGVGWCVVGGAAGTGLCIHAVRTMRVKGPDSGSELGFIAPGLLPRPLARLPVCLRCCLPLTGLLPPPHPPVRAPLLLHPSSCCRRLTRPPHPPVRCCRPGHRWAPRWSGPPPPWRRHPPPRHEQLLSSCRVDAPQQAAAAAAAERAGTAQRRACWGGAVPATGRGGRSSDSGSNGAGRGWQALGGCGCVTPCCDWLAARSLHARQAQPGRVRWTRRRRNGRMWAGARGRANRGGGGVPTQCAQQVWAADYTASPPLSC
jgi:hypothetical protein